MRFNLTFNKPAVTNLLAGVKALRVKIVDGELVFRAAEKDANGRDVFPLAKRTRGGVGIEIAGNFAEQFVQQTGLDRGHHLTLEQGPRGAIHATLFTEESKTGKPSKIIPTARLWRMVDETGSKDEVAPAKAPRKAAAKKGAAKKAAPKKAAAKKVAEKADKPATKKAAAKPATKRTSGAKKPAAKKVSVPKQDTPAVQNGNGNGHKSDAAQQAAA